MNRNDSKLYASFNGNYLSSIEFRNFKSGFEWKNIPNTFSIIIGINGTGKTGLLHLIEKIAEIHASQ
jgi:predicted ATPase